MVLKGRNLKINFNRENEQELIDFHKRQLNNQINLLKGVPYWYAPVMIGPFLMSIEHIIISAPTFEVIIRGVLYSLSIIGITIWVILANKKGVNKMKKELEVLS